MAGKTTPQGDTWRSLIEGKYGKPLTGGSRVGVLTQTTLQETIEWHLYNMFFREQQNGSYGGYKYKIDLWDSKNISVAYRDLVTAYLETILEGDSSVFIVPNMGLSLIHISEPTRPY